MTHGQALSGISYRMRVSENWRFYGLLVICDSMVAAQLKELTRDGSSTYKKTLVTISQSYTAFVLWRQDFVVVC